MPIAVFQPTKKSIRLGTAFLCPVWLDIERRLGTYAMDIFWVSDIGGRIKGRLRFDISIGHERADKLIKRFDKTKWREKVV